MNTVLFGVGIGIGVVAVAEVAGVVVVQQIVVAGFAVRIDGMRQRLKIGHNAALLPAELGPQQFAVGTAAVRG